MMGLYFILWSIDYRPEKMEINGKLLISTHALCRSNKDSFAKVTPSRPKTFVLTLSKMFCHFEIHPNENMETVLVYIGKECICMRTSCNFLFVDNLTVDTTNHSNICTCLQDEILVI